MKMIDNPSWEEDSAFDNNQCKMPQIGTMAGIESNSSKHYDNLRLASKS